ncbi:unnamed protein product [Mytilus coruscus]|uniref:Endonuclease/exonuclease/phosphatase domain-containing protein n=1 Tax=Mytilus coruscus TaxID=42192 RepID=A0A6J8DHL0_MYTCO|nr:unnamed protein product [Mytilus coruscus]
MSEDYITIIGGDFNVDISCENVSTKSNALKCFSDSRNIKVAHLLNDVTGPKYTFRNKDKSQQSLIDYICIPEILENDISKMGVRDDCPYDFSDHYSIYMSLNNDLLCGSSGSFKLGRHVLKWMKADELEIKIYQTDIDKILNISKPKIDNCSINDLEHYYTVLTNALHMSANAYIPCGKFRHYLKPYWKSNDLNIVHYEQREARHEWKNNNKPRNKSNRLYKEYKDKKKKIFRKHKRQTEKLWREKKYEDIKNATKVNIWEFFRTARKMRKQGPATDKLVYDDTEAKTPGDICMLWGKYLENLYSIKEENCFDKEFHGKISKKVNDLFNNKYKGYIDTLDKPITVDEIKDQVRTLKADKSPGQDYISNEHILYGGESLLKHLSTLLNVVNSYALKWRLKYNASKSSVLTFTPPRKTRNNNDSAACLNLGNIVLERKRTCTYAGTLINSDGKTFDRSDNSNKKLKQKLHSLYTVGVNPRGMSALTNNLIWKRIILTTALYGCETWGQLPYREIEMVEITQRYFVRFILMMDKQSPTDSCISNFGLWSAEGYIDKMKLCFLEGCVVQNQQYINGCSIFVWDKY